MTKTFIKYLCCAAFIGFHMSDPAYAQKKSVPVSSKVKRNAVFNITVTGTVNDAASGKPIPGINVSYGAISADVTDGNGQFTIKLPTGKEDIYIQGEGYEPKQVSLNGSNKVTISLNTTTDASFQRTAHLQYEDRLLRASTAALSTVSVEGNWARPFETIDEILQGKVSGLQSIRRSGSTLKGANLHLRGYNSLYATSAPLIVVDGMLYDNQDYGSSIIGNQYANPLSLIHAQDIDHISVIKDGTAEYGTKGANGVIVITTARARKQATAIDFSVYSSFNERPDGLSLMDASAYRTYLNEVLLSQGLAPAQIAAMPFMNDARTGNPSYFRFHNNTNWQDQVLRNSMNKNIYLKVTGGDNIATYALSIGLSNAEGIMKSNSLTKYNTRFNAAFNFSKRFTGQANLAFTFSEQQNRHQGIDAKLSPLYVALTKSPFLMANEVNELGVLSPNFEDTDILGISNPMALVNRAIGQGRQYRFAGSYTFNYAISKTIGASAMIGVMYDKNRENLFIPRKGVADDTLSNAIADSRLGAQVRRLFNTYFDTKLSYNNTFGFHHHVSARLGLRYQKNAAEQDFTLGYNSATDDLISVQNGVASLKQNGGATADWNWMNTYLNLEYGFKDRLFLQTSASLDASSRFGQQAAHAMMINKVPFAFNPSLGASWIVFSSKGFIDLLKLRTTLSRVGNDDIGYYGARQTYGSVNLLGMQGLVRNGIPNNRIGWERNSRFNFGVDLSIWNDRWTTSFDVYMNRTSNMLVRDPLPTASGFDAVMTNAGVMRNTGVEWTSNLRLINQRKFKWDLGFTYAMNQNQLIAVPGDYQLITQSGATLLNRTGMPAAQFFGHRALSIFSTSEEALASGLKTKLWNGAIVPFQAGDVKFQDVNNDGLIDDSDRQILGSALPKYHGSFQSKISLGKFTVEALFTFVQGVEIFNQLRYQLEQSSSVSNQLTSVVNRWRAEGQIASMPKVAAGDPRGNNRFSDRWIEDGSYLRLRSLILSYNLDFGDKFFKNATLYATGNNLFTWTKYTGYDPEFSLGNSIFQQGIDAGLDPIFRSVTIGIRLGL